MTPLLEVRGLHLHYATKAPLFSTARRSVAALSDVTFAMQQGEVLGIVGESGCGKSSLGRVVSGLVAPSAGEVLWEGRRVDTLPTHARGALRRELQLVFQDPRSSLDPRMTVGESIAEPLAVWSPELDAGKLSAQWLTRVGLDEAMTHRYPHELSGGQCQRVAIARAFVLHPKLVICDEAVSALDVSVQAQVISLLRELSQEFRLSLMFISHNLAVVRGLSDRVLVLYLGRVMEIGAAAEVLDEPRHPYTQSLLDAVLSGDPTKRRPPARPAVPEPPPSSSIHAATGCVFRTRCPSAFARCEVEVPVLTDVSRTRKVACHLEGSSRAAL
jgi:oligopeptide transport system ATP-binding protein